MHNNAFIYPQGRRPRIPMPRGNFGLPRGKDMILPGHYEDQISANRFRSDWKEKHFRQNKYQSKKYCRNNFAEKPADFCVQNLFYEEKFLKYANHVFSIEYSVS